MTTLDKTLRTNFKKNIRSVMKITALLLVGSCAQMGLNDAHQYCNKLEQDISLDPIREKIVLHSQIPQEDYYNPGPMRLPDRTSVSGFATEKEAVALRQYAKYNNECLRYSNNVAFVFMTNFSVEQYVILNKWLNMLAKSRITYKQFNVANSKLYKEEKRLRLSINVYTYQALDPVYTEILKNLAAREERSWVVTTAEKEKSKKSSSGSGLIFTQDGKTLTNYHVVEDCEKIEVDYQGRRFLASILAKDQENDIAILKAKISPDSFAIFRKEPKIRVGEKIVAVGFPLKGLLASDINVTTGIISALAGPLDDVRLLQITAPVQSGNSGGPLLDESGNVVGIIVSKLDAVKVAIATGDIPQNVNFAIKPFIIKEILGSHALIFEERNLDEILSIADIAERAREYTISIECIN